MHWHTWYVYYAWPVNLAYPKMWFRWQQLEQSHSDLSREGHETRAAFLGLHNKRHLRKAAETAMRQLNNIRVENGVGLLVWNEQLFELCSLHNMMMVRCDTLNASHFHIGIEYSESIAVLFFKNEREMRKRLLKVWLKEKKQFGLDSKEFFSDRDLYAAISVYGTPQKAFVTLILSRELPFGQSLLRYR